MESSTIKLDPEQERALKLMLSGKNVFLTGELTTNRIRTCFARHILSTSWGYYILKATQVLIIRYAKKRKVDHDFN